MGYLLYVLGHLGLDLALLKMHHLESFSEGDEHRWVANSFAEGFQKAACSKLNVVQMKQTHCV